VFGGNGCGRRRSHSRAFLESDLTECVAGKQTLQCCKQGCWRPQVLRWSLFGSRRRGPLRRLWQPRREPITSPTSR
jgi:hypothetical protein